MPVDLYSHNPGRYLGCQKFEALCPLSSLWKPGLNLPHLGHLDPLAVGVADRVEGLGVTVVAERFLSERVRDKCVKEALNLQRLLSK